MSEEAMGKSHLIKYVYECSYLQPVFVDGNVAGVLRRVRKTEGCRCTTLTSHKIVVDQDESRQPELERTSSSPRKI